MHVFSLLLAVQYELIFSNLTYIDALADTMSAEYLALQAQVVIAVSYNLPTKMLLDYTDA